ncbi:PQQ-binding-like beta-propeller repeat protein [Bacillus sp. SM2101]|uniref:PQQ-binding-like beta-propeller repeat protein n=1 Tax=Bacillus sp. SM2101 TaxID=2805366 RepID=UPI001BDE7269|nr:PQQ-binding-like beta-propeller repeat protein [Bacillus sp. SM2101]
MRKYIELLKNTQYKNNQKDRQLISDTWSGSSVDYKKKPHVVAKMSYDTHLWSIPALLSGKNVIFGCWDGKIRCINKDTLDLVWTFNTDGPVYSSPVVLNDNSFIIGSEDGFLRRISANGYLIWEFKAGETFHQVPAIDTISKRVFAGNYDGILYALNLDTGELLWKKKYEHFSDWEAISTSISITSNNDIVFGNGYNIFRLDKDGNELWNNRVYGYLKPAPALCYKKDIGFSGTTSGLIFGFNSTSGKILWKIETLEEVGVSGAISYDNIGCIYSYNGTVYGIDLTNGEILWEYFQGKQIEEQYTSVTVLPNGDFLFVGGPRNTLKSLNYKDGKVNWEIEFDKGVHSSPLITIHSEIFIGSNSGSLYKLEWKNN